jgi:hypothetical protein
MASSPSTIDAANRLIRITHYASGAYKAIDEKFAAAYYLKNHACRDIEDFKGPAEELSSCWVKVRNAKNVQQAATDCDKQVELLKKEYCPSAKEENKYAAQSKAALRAEWKFLHKIVRGNNITVTEFLGKLEGLKGSDAEGIKEISADIDAIVPLLQSIEKPYGNVILFNLGYDHQSHADFNPEAIELFSNNRK